MEEQHSPASSIAERIEDVAGKLNQGRTRAREFLAAQRGRLKDLELEFAERVAGLQQTCETQQATQQGFDRLAAELTGSRQELEGQLSALAEQRKKLAAAQKSIRDRGRRVAQMFRRQRARHYESLEAHRAELEDLNASENEDLVEKRRQVDTLTQQLEEARTELVWLQTQLARDGERSRQTSAEIDQARAATEQSRQELDERSSQLQQQHDECRRLAEQLAHQQETIDSQSQQLTAIAADYEALATSLRGTQDELNTARGDAETRSQQLAAAAAEREALATALHEAEASRREAEERLSAARGEAEAQSQQLDAVRAEHEALATALREAEARLSGTRQAAEEQSRQLDQMAAARQSLATALREAQDRLAAARQDETAALEQLQEKLELALEEVGTLRKHNATLAAELARQVEAAPSVVHELESLRAERDTLIERLAAAETQAAPTDSDREEFERLERRLEMAIEEIRALKARNASLKQALADAQSITQESGTAGGDPLDWEAQKRRLLAELDAEGDDGSPLNPGQRASFEERIRFTDEVIAAKDRAMQDLQQQIKALQAAHDSQSAQEDAAKREVHAVATLLSQDEVVAHERDRLRQLQAEWEGKLRQAEVEMSIERAKISRQSAELDGQREALQAQRTSTGGPAGGKPVRGRWLARLGLQDSDDA